RHVYVHSRTEINSSIIFDHCDIGRGCKIRRAILEKNVQVTPGTVIGYNLDEDRKRYTVTDSGIVIVEGKRTPVELTAINL
ncbi:MAG: GlgC family sugar phosphate nucleotidyltransferase, partial [Hyphomicrobium sp.]